MRDQILEQCKAEHITINSYVVQAIEEKMARGTQPPEVLERISTQLAAIAAHLGIPADNVTDASKE